MRRYILAMLVALVLVVGALAMNKGVTDPRPPQRSPPSIPHDFRLR
jgi:hypothetical protein